MMLIIKFDEFYMLYDYIKIINPFIKLPPSIIGILKSLSFL